MLLKLQFVKQHPSISNRDANVNINLQKKTIFHQRCTNRKNTQTNQTSRETTFKGNNSKLVKIK